MQPVAAYSVALVAASVAVLLSLFLLTASKVHGNKIIPAVLSWILLFGSGLLAGSWVLHSAAFSLPERLDQQELQVVGRICSVPEIIFHNAPDAQSREISSFLFCPDDSIPQDTNLPNYLRNSVLKLSCYYCGVTVQENRYYQIDLKLRLKRPLQNFHDPWEWQKQWRYPWHARGVVRGIEALDTPRSPSLAARVLDIKTSVRQSSLTAMANSSHIASMAALLWGDKSGLDSSRWQHLADSGLTHLLVISGLHVGCLIVFISFLARLIFSKINRKISLYLTLATVALLLGLYFCVVEYGVPIVRATSAAGTVAYLSLSRRKVLPSTWFLAVLTLCSLVDPFAFVSRGFWLSFSGVALLLLVFGHRPLLQPGKVKSLWRAQVGFYFGLTGLLTLFFTQVSMTGLLANLLAVPLVSLVILPLGLLGVVVAQFSSFCGAFLFGLVDGLFSGFWLIVEFSTQLPVLNLAARSTEVALCLMALGGVGLVHFRLPFAWLVLPMVFFSSAIGIKPAEPLPFQLTALDVGQGLAIVLQSAGLESADGATVLYDAGPATPAWNAGQTVVIPALLEAGTKLDAMIVSHNDSDHAGGANVVVQAFPKVNIWAGQLEAVTRSQPCQPGLTESVGEMELTFLWPPANYQGNDNNRSCVVRIRWGNLSVLLPGDIEKQAQQQLMTQYSELKEDPLRADILILPHHGSGNAFDPYFLSRVEPQLAIAGAGYQNAFGHPHWRFEDWFEPRDIPLLVTGEFGAIRVTAVADDANSASTTDLMVETAGISGKAMHISLANRNKTRK